MPKCLFAWSLCFWVYPATLGPREMNRAIRAESRVHGHDKPPGSGRCVQPLQFILYDDNQFGSFLIGPNSPDVVAHNPAAACPHSPGRYVQGLCPRSYGIRESSARGAREDSSIYIYIWQCLFCIRRVNMVI